MKLQQKNPEFTEILYARLPYWIRHFEFWDSDFRFVIYDPQNFRNDYVFFATHLKKN